MLIKISLNNSRYSPCTVFFHAPPRGFKLQYFHGSLFQISICLNQPFPELILSGLGLLYSYFPDLIFQDKVLQGSVFPYQAFTDSALTDLIFQDSEFLDLFYLDWVFPVLVSLVSVIADTGCPGLRIRSFIDRNRRTQNYHLYLPKKVVTTFQYLLEKKPISV